MKTIDGSHGDGVTTSPTGYWFTLTSLVLTLLVAFGCDGGSPSPEPTAGNVEESAPPRGEMAGAAASPSRDGGTPPDVRVDADRPDAEAPTAVAEDAAVVESDGSREGQGASIPPWRWREPGCFAWSPRSERYACIALRVTPSRTSPQDVSTTTFDDTYAHARRIGAELRLGVVLVGPDHGPDARESRWRRIDSPSSWDPQSPIGIDEMREWLRQGGFTEPVPEQARLPDGEWTAFGDVEYRFTHEFHEGSASYEIAGDLHIRCEPGARPVEVLSRVDLGGPLAMLSRAEGTSRIALTIEVHDGGEGYTDVTHGHWLFDEREYCPER